MKDAGLVDRIGLAAWWMIFIVGSIELKHIAPVDSRSFWVITLIFIGLSTISFCRGTLKPNFNEEIKKKLRKMD